MLSVYSTAVEIFVKNIDATYKINDDVIRRKLYSRERTVQKFYPTISDRQAQANSVDLDQTPQNAASDLGLHCLPLI